MKIKLQEILDNKNISVYSLSKEIGVTQNNLGKLVKGETTSIKYDILESLCIALKITPNEIFEIDYPYPTNQIYSKSLMKNYSEEESYFDPLANMNTDELEEYKKISTEYQMRFEAEQIFDSSVDTFINKVIESYISNITMDESYKQVFENYKEYDYFTTNLKVKRFYRILHPFLSIHSKDYNLLLLLDDIKNVYDKGDIENLTDDRLNELQNGLNYYIENGIPVIPPINQKD